eukprot:m.125481 g.125481  ORF g.125481 m.125481 type:complete len:54 (+) comp9691_c1_seq1:338-499(+)
MPGSSVKVPHQAAWRLKPPLCIPPDQRGRFPPSGRFCDHHDVALCAASGRKST